MCRVGGDASVRVARPARVPLARLAWLALVTGALGFGGGFAVLARVRRSVVEDRGWVTAEELVEIIAVASALPGALAPNVFALLGHRLAGIRGAVVAEAAFVLPSAALMVAFGATYDRFRALSEVRAAFAGVNPAVVGVVAAVAVEMGRDAVRSWKDGLVAALAALALVSHTMTLLEVVVVAGLVGALASARGRPVAAVAPLLVTIGSLPPLLGLLVVFAKIGAATFGGGFAMIPAIAQEAVGRGWVTAQAFADAIALGQITPGPVAISATFIGYRAAGIPGAAAATLGIFAPPFVIAVAAARSLAAFRASRIVQGMLAGIAPAVVGIIVAASYALGTASDALGGELGIAIAVGSFVVSVCFPRVNALVPIALGGALGVITSMAGAR